MDCIQGIQVARDVALVGLGVWAIKEFIRRDEDRRALEHKVRFSALHEKRVATVGELYRLLVRAGRSLQHARDPSPPGSETLTRIQAFGEDANAFYDLFSEHRIWLPEKTCDLIERFWKALKDAGYEFVDSQQEPRTGSREKTRALLTEHVEPLKREIECEFRRLLDALGFDERA